MLSLNSYGLAKSSNQLTLPRIHSPIRASNASSVGKLAQERRGMHPWYRTTSGFEYGRHVDFQDLGLNLTPVKAHAKHMDFTSGFLDGPYTDSSLGSLEMKKKRLILSDELRAERKIRMKQKFDEKQLQLSFKREIRRELREKRRVELQEQQQASIIIQRHIRGTLTRLHLEAARQELRNNNARRIQMFYRSKMRIYAAKQELQRIKDDIRDDAARIIQRQVRRRLARSRAQAELNRRRQQRATRRDEIRRELVEARTFAATQIERIVRGFLARQRLRQRTTGTDATAAIATQPSTKRKPQPTQPQAPSKPKPAQTKPPAKKKPALGARRLSSAGVGSLNDV
ncbi:hypothetical protein Ae201684P_007127 [Aphanomyces euteiches]|uniref:Uncharacterized protein n=1 Tax=Aphanomyces euteiches TaxID=100861 RepID=A0A6G0X900_9STRA|nr:hypothetical protein Ae201684_007472 [Aphanomyces euteiches]KAH9100936.1 hypothetical protein Ae201684P_007127 [Aphanomyces euteiches]KAH9152298.1 hypothetical protein AeRB84_005246 [Aphanomyces euteiches]